mgnify:CR=1 FL=1
MVTVVEPNWITNLIQGIAGIAVFVGIWLAWKQYKYQRMESVEKANKQIAQNDEMIQLLKEIKSKIN